MKQKIQKPATITRIIVENVIKILSHFSEVAVFVGYVSLGVAAYPVNSTFYTESLCFGTNALFIHFTFIVITLNCFILFQWRETWL